MIEAALSSLMQRSQPWLAGDPVLKMGTMLNHLLQRDGFAAR